MTATVSLEKLNKKRAKDGYIALDSFRKLKESGNVYGSNAKFWFKFKDGRVLYKEYNEQAEAFGEVLYSKLANKYGINCAKYDFASFGEGKGTISYDIVENDDQMIVDGLTLFFRYGKASKWRNLAFDNKLETTRLLNKKFNNYGSFTELLSERYPSDDYPGTLEKLQDQMIHFFILDVLLDHVDKNLWNIMLRTNKYGKDPALISIDSSHIACLYQGEKFIQDAVSKLLEGSDSLTIEDFLAGGAYGYDVDVKKRGYNPANDLIDFYIKSDDKQRDIIYNYIKEVEIDETINEILSIKNYRINPIVVIWVKAVFNSRKAFLLKKCFHINGNIQKKGMKNLFF